MLAANIGVISHVDVALKDIMDPITQDHKEKAMNALELDFARCGTCADVKSMLLVQLQKHSLSAAVSEDKTDDDKITIGPYDYIPITASKIADVLEVLRVCLLPCLSATATPTNDLSTSPSSVSGLCRLIGAPGLNSSALSMARSSI